jgi:hypothetical protein
MGLAYGLFEEGGIGPYHRAKVSDGMGCTMEDRVGGRMDVGCTHPVAF